MATFSVTSDLDRLARNAGRVQAIVNRECLTIVRAVTLDAERYAKVAAPVFRGDLRRSITSKATQTASGATGEVGTNKVYGRVVEEGRRPGRMPPVRAIAVWAARKAPGASTFVIARAIARRGTRPQPYLRPAAARAVRESPRHVRPAVKRMLAGVGGL